jgi:hypothetical protein
MRRGHATVLAIAAAIGLSASAPSFARAAGCTDEWTNAAGGSWFAGANWSNGTPPGAEEDACITANGTYTVTMTQTETTGRVTVRSLTVGGPSGTQTLTVGVCSPNDKASLAATAGISNGSNGAIVLTGVPPGSGEACGAPGSTRLIGSVSNAGTIAVEPVSNGALRYLQGVLTNTGTLAIEATTAYDKAGATLTNEGAIDVAGEAQLTLPSGVSLTNAAGGSIAAAGDGEVLVEGAPLEHATFTEGAGSISGSRPVVVNNGTLNYTGTPAAHGAGPIVAQGRSTLTGNVRHGQSLVVESTCAENADITSEGEERPGGDFYFTNGGMLEFTSDSCGGDIAFELGKGFVQGRFENYGTLVADNPHGGSFSLESCVAVTNYGVLQLDPAPTHIEGRPARSLEVACPFNQESSGTFKTFIAGTSDFGHMSSIDGVVAGALVVHPLAPFVGLAGEMLPIINGGAGGLARYFATEIENPVNYTGLYYKPTYGGAEGDRLVVTQATLRRAPGKGAPGTLVTVNGTGYAQPGYIGIYPIVLTFTDHEGVKTEYPITLMESAIVHAGEFTTQIEIPATAALGAGKLTVSGTKSDVHISLPFTVT